MTRWFKAAAGIPAVAGMILLGGCNLAPVYRPPVMPAPAAYKPLPGWVTAAPCDTIPRGDWWTVFADPVLDQLEEKLDGSNPDLAAAVARYDEARAYAEQARSGLLPSIGLQGNAMQNRQSEDRPLRGSNLPNNYGSDQVNGVASFELDLWGKLRNGLRSRKALAQASDDDRAAMQLSLEAQLASSYFELRGLDADALLPVIPASVPATLLQRRPDIASAERAIASANAEIGVARAAFYPTISLSGMGGVMSQGTNPFSLGDLFWSLGPSVSLPLFEGGLLKGQLAYDYARFRETSAHYKSTALAAFKEVEDDRALLFRLEQEGVSSNAAATAAQQTTAAATGIYSDGATSYLEVVTAQTAQLQAQQAALDIRTRHFVAAVNFIRALGGGWTAPA